MTVHGRSAVHVVCNTASESSVASSMFAGWKLPLDCARGCFISGRGNYEWPGHRMAVFERLVDPGRYGITSSRSCCVGRQ